ncbi:uncharacterized protein LOC124272473 [Haliotis rubra]|uniref:uncharacterized protein LOC124272473 n=1 Tax=Haliotis rubra TaxID=36100 RepID=UPI001EE5E222|nr:uncharacterized protein LOC124272473 [Haliotis rubra]
MSSSQGVIFVLAGFALLALVNAEALDDNTAASLYKLLQPAYESSAPEKRESDLNIAFDAPPDPNWTAGPSTYGFGSLLRRAPAGYRRNLIEDKRFGYVGSRGKRTQLGFGYVGSRGKRTNHAAAFVTLRDLLDMYEDRARALPFRSADLNSLSQDSTLLNSKRQPHFGFHGVRG